MDDTQLKNRNERGLKVFNISSRRSNPVTFCNTFDMFTTYNFNTMVLLTFQQKYRNVVNMQAIFQLINQYGILWLYLFLIK